MSNHGLRTGLSSTEGTQKHIFEVFTQYRAGGKAKLQHGAVGEAQRITSEYATQGGPSVAPLADLTGGTAT